MPQALDLQLKAAVKRLGRILLAQPWLGLRDPPEIVAKRSADRLMAVEKMMMILMMMMMMM
eukprot:1457799-Karenia_brevis.AAC.1